MDTLGTYYCCRYLWKPLAIRQPLAMATPNRVGLLISQSNCEFLTTRGSNHNVKRGQYILTGLFDGDLSSPCYKDRRRILCRLFRAPWWFRPRHLTPHPVSQPGFLPVIILATAGLRLLIREGPPPYVAANLHANAKAVPTSPPVVARSLQDSLLARSA